jgi:DNA modification methylase
LQPPFSSIIPYFVKPGTYEKTLYFMERMLYAYTERGDMVVDLFSGQGNTLLICERAGRRCVAMDLNPACCQGTLDRWEAYTTLKPRLLIGSKAET